MDGIEFRWSVTTKSLEVLNLQKKFGKNFAVKDISFHVGAGEIVGLVGLNGAGKTTALKIILGLIQADSGSVSIDTGTERRRGDIGFLPEESDFSFLLTGYETLLFAAALAGKIFYVEEVFNKTGIFYAKDKRIGTYSKGMKRRLGLACALVTLPKLIVLDEPQSGLDPLGRRGLASILEEERSKGNSILIASHDLNETAEICDRVVVIHKGRDIAVLEREKISDGKLKEKFFELIESDLAECVVK